ncbi:MAG: alpha/beta hydrolase [Bacteroidota bacterium]
MGLTLSAQKTASPFSFSYDGKTLHGLIESPGQTTPKAMVLIIPGYGRTNFVEGGMGGTLRDSLVAAGLAVCFWDKQGCGKSEGKFDAQQPVEDSAKEALAAIKALEQMEAPGVKTLGLWGLSRAGWICPLLNELYPVDFWISVSGTNDKENYGYLLRSNLLIAGMPEEKAEKLYQAWLLGHKIYSTGGTYEDYVAATAPIGADSLCQELFGNKPVVEITEDDLRSYAKNQQNYTSKGRFDEASGLWSYIENFDELLKAFNCPVLAIFGANDSQVDWRLTKSLYEETIGTNPKAKLTSQVFDQCNHIIRKCETCAYREDLSHLDWAPCPGYYALMKSWLKTNSFVD